MLLMICKKYLSVSHTLRSIINYYNSEINCENLIFPIWIVKRETS